MPIVYAKNLRLKGDEEDGIAALGGAVRRWIGDRWPVDQAWFQPREHGSLRAPDGSIYRWEPYSEQGRELVDFTWRHPDRGNPSVSWVTTVTYFRVAGKTELALRVSNTSESGVGGGPMLTTRPRLLLELAKDFNLEGLEGRVQLDPPEVAEGDVRYFVRYELFDPERKYPVLVLTPTAAGDHVVAPRQVGAEFLTLAKTVRLPTSAATFALTEELGDKALSVFHGAARIYLPGFQSNSDPFRHPLLLPGRLATADSRTAVAQILAVDTVRHYRDPAAIPLLRDERAVAAEVKRTAAMKTLAQEASKDVDTYSSLAESYRQDYEALRAEKGDLENTNRALEERIRLLEQKCAALEYAIERKGGVAPTTMAPEIEVKPESVLEAVEQAQLLFEGDLVILESALEAARESGFVRPGRVFEMLKAMADISRTLRAGAPGRPLKELFIERGLEYQQGITKNSSETIREQYHFAEAGKTYSCYEHVGEGNSYNHERCLRIYFVSETGVGIVVGHVGRHLDTDQTT